MLLLDRHTRRKTTPDFRGCASHKRADNAVKNAPDRGNDVRNPGELRAAI
jgi:hypothetical protein